MKLIFAVVAVALCLAGCTTASNLATISTAADLAASINGPIPNQATTLGDALQFATLATKATDVIVKDVKLSQAQLTQLNADSDALHAALVKLEADNSAGKALDFSAFNAGLAAYNTYTAELPAK